ncbi:MAG TPA: DNA repair protein RecN, partial [Fimbriimonadaceae bacterium]|nr:DNA repair protein RecN [Fimbriimonadaceae bacterium]
KLETLSAHTQVLVISHLPQIASRASTQYRIEKGEIGGRVSTSIRRLEEGERVEEIARMLAGEQLSESALANARELLGSSS